MTERARSVLRAVVRVAATALIFLLVGPFFGAFVFLGAGLPLTTGESDMAVFGPLLVIGWFWIVLPIAYFIGGLPAAATGVVVALASRVDPPPAALYLIAAATGAVLSIGFLYGGLVQDLFGSRTDQAFAAATALAGAVSALPCTRLTRRFRLAPRPAGDAPAAPAG